jgi:hypothetical protein
MTSEYSLGLWRALERTLSKGRLNYYLDLAEQKTGKKNEKQKAFELHCWNTLLSESLYVPLQGFEITLRNAMDECISAYYEKQARTTEWYQDKKWLKTWCAARDRGGIGRARGDSEKMEWLTRSTAHSHFVAATMLGLWVNLLSADYERFWEEVLKNAFWQGTDREKLYMLARQCNDIRNRVAHYEPVMIKRLDDLELDQLHDEVVRFIGSVCPETSNWVRRSSRFEDAWKAKPAWW